jgi:hypothetical protein
MLGMEKEFKELSLEVKNMGKEFVEMNYKLTQLYDSIVGNQKFGHYGLVERVNQLEKKVQGLNYLKSKIIGFSIGFGAISTLLVEFIKMKFFK